MTDVEQDLINAIQKLQEKEAKEEKESKDEKENAQDDRVVSTPEQTNPS